jgi:hypothetical protein
MLNSFLLLKRKYIASVEEVEGHVNVIGRHKVDLVAEFGDLSHVPLTRHPPQFCEKSRL